MRALGLLIAIGTLDLLATAVLSAQGRIEELNPLMASFLASGAGAFIVVKGATLGLAWLLLVRQRRVDPALVRRACLGGSAVYLTLLAFAFSRSAS